MDPLKQNPEPPEPPPSHSPPDSPKSVDDSQLENLDAERSLNASEALIRSLYKLWRFTATGDLAKKLETAVQQAEPQKEAPMPDISSRPEDEATQQPPVPPGPPVPQIPAESSIVQETPEPVQPEAINPEANPGPTAETESAFPDSLTAESEEEHHSDLKEDPEVVSNNQPDSPTLSSEVAPSPVAPQRDEATPKPEDSEIGEAAQKIEEEIDQLRNEAGVGHETLTVDDLRQEIDQIIEAAASLDKPSPDTEPGTLVDGSTDETPYESPGKTSVESINEEDLSALENLPSVGVFEEETGDDDEAMIKEMLATVEAEIDRIQEPPPEEYEAEMGGMSSEEIGEDSGEEVEGSLVLPGVIEESDFQAVSTDDLTAELNALMLSGEDPALETPEKTEPVVVCAPMEESVVEESDFQAISEDDLAAELNALLLSGEGPASETPEKTEPVVVCAPVEEGETTEAPEPSVSVETDLKEIESVSEEEETTNATGEEPLIDADSDAGEESAMAPESAANSNDAEATSPVVASEDLSGLDDLIAVSVEELLRGDIKAVDEALDSIFEKEAVLAEIGELEPEMGDLSMLVCDDEVEVDESTIGEQVASYQSKQRERERAAGRTTNGLISDEGTQSSVANVASSLSSTLDSEIAGLEANLDAEDETSEIPVDSEDFSSPPSKESAPAPPPTVGMGSGLDPSPAGGSNMEVKPQVLAATRMVKPAAIAALKGLNYPLRFLPESSRTLVDFIALTLVFWVPIVWVFVIFIL